MTRRPAPRRGSTPITAPPQAAGASASLLTGVNDVVRKAFMPVLADVIFKPSPSWFRFQDAARKRAYAEQHGKEAADLLWGLGE